MQYVRHGTAWGFARWLWVAVGLTLAAGCSSGISSDLAGDSGGGGGNGGFGGRANGDAVVEEGERAILPGSLDDVFAIGPTPAATACTLDAQCATGYCMDGYCCDTRCDNKCMACSAAKKGSGVDGVCGSIAYDTDPDNDCPVGACDGKNQCKNYNGVPCGAAPQCLSNYCVDGFCCGNICMGSCSACSASKKGSGSDGVCGVIKAATDPDNECNPGECTGSGACNAAQTTAANGVACTSAAQCTSGFCADGVCCDSWCLGSCQACTVAKKGSGVNGVCGPIANDQDPDDECWGGACNGAGVCKQYNGVPCTGKSQCLSNYCVDGVCCGNICNTLCNACSVGKKGQGYDGVCGPIASGRDIDSECNPGECNGSGACNQAQTPQGNGTVCVSGGQCASSNCVDGVCCDTACAGTCTACTTAKKGSGADGVCGNIISEQDPDIECNGGKCDGNGVCRFYNGAPCSSIGQCFSNYCVDGFCCGNVCTGACQACSTAKKGSGYDGVCGSVANATDPDNECNPGECNGGGACNQPQSQQPNGSTCTLATQCTSGFCTDGVCCDAACPGLCVACTAAKKGQGANGTCGVIITGTDPENECMNSDCNGAGACTTPTNLPNGSTCTAGTQCASTNCIDGVCCDTACSGVCVACSATKKGQGTDGTCGPIKYDTDPDDECYGGGCNGASACGSYNGVPCILSTTCLSAYCVDGTCCNNHCGGTCYACSAAKKGSGFDGVCSFIKSNVDPDNECAGTNVCNGAGVCVGGTCSTNADCAANATCANTTCTCNSGYTGDGFLTCTDIDECQISNGGCSANATCTNTPGSRTCACNAGYTGDGITCTDVNECLTNNGGCDVNATCTNTPGSRTCTCNAGYTGDGFSCVTTPIVVVSAGVNGSCAKANDGSVKCWGINSYGMLGLGDTQARGDQPGEMGSNLPVLNLGTGKSVVQLSMGVNHGCALLNDTTVKCWGYGAILGAGDTMNRGDDPGEMGDNLPTVDLGTGLTVVEVAAGSNHDCARFSNGSIKCWGYNGSGELGLGDTNSRGTVPGQMGNNLPTVNLGTGKTATKVVVNGGTTCVILNDGTVKCWGYNGQGTLGTGDTIARGDNPGEMGDNLAPIALGTGKTATSIAAGIRHVCVVLNDASLKCWGENYNGTLGLGDRDDRGDNPGEMGDSLPAVNLGTGKTALAVSAGDGYTCALLNDHTVKCWGTTIFGQTGTGVERGTSPGSMGDNLPIVSLGTGKSVDAISLSWYFACALLTDGHLKCWGKNAIGELGLGDTLDRGANAALMGDNLPVVNLF